MRFVVDYSVYKCRKPDNKNCNNNEDYQSLWQHFERNSNLREKRMIEL